jgi:hypothetical protein
MKEFLVTDNNDLARFGYRQESKRSMGGFSSFAAGFSYFYSYLTLPVLSPTRNSTTKLIDQLN